MCKKLGQTDAAMRHFTIALDLHNKVKGALRLALHGLFALVPVTPHTVVVLIESRRVKHDVVLRLTLPLVTVALALAFRGLR